MAASVQRRASTGTRVRDDLRVLIGQVYETIDEPEVWETLLISLQQALRADSVVFVFQAHNPRTISNVYCVGRLKERIAADQESYVLNEPLLNGFTAEAFPPGSAVNATEIVAGNRDDMPVFLDEWMKPEGITQAGAIGVRRSNGVAALILVYTSKRGEAINQRAKRLLEEFCPHFERALRISEQQESIRTRETNVLNVLDRLTTGVVLLDGAGVPVYSNAAMGRITKRHPSIRITRNGLYFKDNPEECARIQQAIRGTAGQRSHPGALREAFTLSIRLRGSELPLSVLVTSLPGAASPAHPYAPRTALYITDPEYAGPISSKHLETNFGLTSTEAAVAVDLASGLCVDKIAANRGVSVATVRTQIRSTLRKTGLRRQVDVIRLLLAGSVVSYVEER